MDTSEPARESRLFWSFGLTPVQSWIAEARRSRDLLAGSQSLAWLMEGLLATVEEAGGKALLPHLEAGELASRGSFATAVEKGTSTISNRASGWIALPRDEVRVFFDSLETRLAESWRQLVREVRTSAARSTERLWTEVGDAVGEPVCPFHLTWAVLESRGDDGEGLAEVERLFTAVKRSRPARQHAGAPVRKCGQCGRREAMGGDDPVRWHAFQKRLEKLDEVRRGLRFEPGEYHCSLCALRRFAGYLREDAFPSTSAIAAREWRSALESQPASSEVRRALAALDDASARVPGYEPRWADRAPLAYRRSAEREVRDARRDEDGAREGALRAVVDRQQDLWRAVERHNAQGSGQVLAAVPPEYLAVVMFDGDDLGRRLREDLERLPALVRDFQNRLAARLADRADALGVAEAFYLGGDEGLLLAPVGAVLSIARQIRVLWTQILGEAAGGAATLSMGVAIFDRERPVGTALETARRSLEISKRLPGKDALTVSVQTASGSIWVVTGRWRDDWVRIEQAVDLIREGRLAAGWSHDVEAFLRTLPPEAFTAGDRSREAIREEVKRLTFRRLQPRKVGGQAEKTESRRKAAWERLAGASWWQEEPAAELLAGQPDQLHLVGFLARQAGPRPEGGAGAAVGEA